MLFLHDKAQPQSLSRVCHGISRQEYWSGLPVPPPGNLPSLRIEPKSPVSLAFQADVLPAEPSGKPTWLEGSLKHTFWINSSTHSKILFFPIVKH